MWFLGHHRMSDAWHVDPIYIYLDNYLFGSATGCPAQTAIAITFPVPRADTSALGPFPPLAPRCIALVTYVQLLAKVG